MMLLASCSRRLLSVPSAQRAPFAAAAAPTTIAEQKIIDKANRTRLYAERQARKLRQWGRRDGRPQKGQRMRDFKAFYDKKRIWEEIQSKKARQRGQVFKIRAAAVIERQPTILPTMESWEADYVELRKTLDLYGDYDWPEEFQIDQIEKEEALEEMMYPPDVTPPPRLTEADHANDVKSLRRKLDCFLYFSLQERADKMWTFPSTELQGDDETLKDAAMRVAKETLGNQITIRGISNAPIAVDLKVGHDEEGVYGTKTFFIKLNYVHDAYQKPESLLYDAPSAAADYGWMHRTELAESTLELEGENASKFYNYMLV